MLVVFTTKQSSHGIIIFPLPGEMYFGIKAGHAVYIFLFIYLQLYTTYLEETQH